MSTASKTTAPGKGKVTARTNAPVELAPRAIGAGQTSQRQDQWRDWYNPLRGQTIANAISLFDLAQAGITAELQWVYQLMERRYDMLMCCIDSTNASLTELNWYVRTTEGDKQQGAKFDQVLADEQASALRERYNSIKNLYGALEHLAMAKYRGYAHVQISADGKWLDTLQPLNQWNVCREGYSGDWFWNPRAVQAKEGVIDTSNKLDESCYLIVECRRCVNEMALLNYLRASMCEKDWDAYIEIYGIPNWIITMPPNIPAGKEDEYRDAAIKVAAGGGGAIPNGATASAATSPAGDAPFQTRREYLSQQICLVSTGGLLTSLSLPQGIGSGATDAHSETFKRIARSRAKGISEEFRAKIDAPILDALFHGKPHLAYFEFDARETTDVGEVLAHAETARRAGVAIDTDQLSDRTGYKLTDAPLPATVRETVDDKNGAPLPITEPTDTLKSRADSVARLSSDKSDRSDTSDATSKVAKAGTELYAKATQQGLRPLAEAIWPLLDIEDPGALAAALQAVLQQFPELSQKVLADNTNAQALQETLNAAAANGLAAAGLRKGDLQIAPTKGIQS